MFFFNEKFFPSFFSILKFLVFEKVIKVIKFVNFVLIKLQFHHTNAQIAIVLMLLNNTFINFTHFLIHQQHNNSLENSLIYDIIIFFSYFFISLYFLYWLSVSVVVHSQFLRTEHQKVFCRQITTILTTECEIKKEKFFVEKLQ